MKTGAFVINGDLYDFLNDVSKVGLPGLGAFYFTVATIWGLPYGDKIVGTIAAIAVLLGIWLKIAKVSYKNKLESEAVVAQVVAVVTDTDTSQN